MIVNRVFCYSKGVAKNNGNKFPILELILTIVLGMMALIVLPIIMKELNEFIFLLIIIIWMGLIIYFSEILGLRMRARIQGYATDTNGRIFKVMTMNNGQGLYFGGLAVGGLIDQLIESDAGIGQNLGGAVGAASQIYSLNRSAKYMSQPEIVAKIVEQAPNVTGAEVFEILKVYLIIDKKKSIKLKCDYKILRTNKIKYRKNLNIEKSYNRFDDLIAILNTHR